MINVKYKYRDEHQAYTMFIAVLFSSFSSSSSSSASFLLILHILIIRTTTIIVINVSSVKREKVQHKDGRKDGG